MIALCSAQQARAPRPKPPSSCATAASKKYIATQRKTSEQNTPQRNSTQRHNNAPKGRRNGRYQDRTTLGMWRQGVAIHPGHEHGRVAAQAGHGGVGAQTS